MKILNKILLRGEEGEICESSLKELVFLFGEEKVKNAYEKAFEKKVAVWQSIDEGYDCKFEFKEV